MTEVPENPVTMEDLTAWYEMQENLKKIKASEMLLRLKIFKHFFPTPEEGTNTFDLPDDFKLKGVYVLNREVDIAAARVLSEQFVAAAIKVDDLITWKPSLSVSEYRTLTAEQMQLFDQCLTVKPGSPSLEITKPKPKGKAKAKA